MSLDWGNGIGVSFQTSKVSEEMPSSFRNRSYFPEKYPIKEDFPFLINPKKFICLQITGANPNEINMVDILSENSEISAVAIDFITFERLFVLDMNTLFSKILKGLNDTPYARLEKYFNPILSEINKKHSQFLNLLERLIKEGPKKFNANFVHFFLGAAGSEILPIHKRYIDQFLKIESCALNFSYTKTSEYEDFLKGRALIQVLRSPIEWQNVTAKTARTLIKLLPKGSNYISDLERFASSNELLANTSDYIPKLEQLSHQFVVEPFQIVVPGRRIIRKGVGKKHCRRKETERTIILFNDILLYAQHKGGMYVSPHYFDLSYVKIEDYQKNNCIIIETPRKSFILEFPTQDIASEWKKDISESIQDVIEETGVDINTIQYAPVWIPDKLADKCMNCNAPFTIVNRRHHCRGCGKIMCSDCLKYKAVIKNISNDPVKICERCAKQYKSCLVK